jgi:hypothetical protein
MNSRIGEQARPQATLLIAATFISVILWIASLYLPLMWLVVYPLQLFATFIHEGGHALAAVLTGNSVESLTVSPDGSGAVWSQSSGWLSQLLISSAGYLGTTAFGAGLLFWIRYGFSSRIALLASAGLIAAMTAVFGILAPVWNLFANVRVGGLAFTVFSGALIAVGLAAVARFATRKWADLALAFLAVQCLLNAVFSLLDVLFISTFTDGHSDAANMAAATGIPGFVWVLIWMAISVVMISLGLRIYAVRRNSGAADSLFDDQAV